MTPELSRRLGRALAEHWVSFDERETVLRAADSASRWADLLPEVAELVEVIEGRPLVAQGPPPNWTSTLAEARDVSRAQVATGRTVLVLLNHPGHADQSSHGRRRASAPPREFGGFDEAKAFLTEHYGAWRADLSSAQSSALATYQSPAFAVMNGRLRGLKPDQIQSDVTVTPALVAKATTATANLRAAIASAPPLPQPIVAHRSFAADQFGRLTVGATVRDRGFTSVSLTGVGGGGGVGGAGRKPAVARITLPAGTRAAGGSAREMVLAPDSSFAITGVSRRGGTTYVDMELVGG